MAQLLSPIALLSAAFLATSSFAQPIAAPSEDATGVVLRSTFGEFSGRGASIDEPIAEVRPGETVTITGDCVAGPSTDSLRVVLTLAQPDGTTAGYRAVLATDQRIHDGNLQIRVPNLPDAEDQVYQVKVFRLGEQTPQICGAGAIRIGAQAEGKVG